MFAVIAREVFLIGLADDFGGTVDAAAVDTLYAQLIGDMEAAGLRVLFDDRGRGDG